MGRGGDWQFFWDSSLRQHLKKSFLNKTELSKKVFFHELLVQVLRKHFRGGGGSRPILIMVILGVSNHGKHAYVILVYY